MTVAPLPEDTEVGSSRPASAATRRAIADVLIRTGAVSFSTSPFFTFTSGTESPIYVDNRRLLGFVAERRVVVERAVEAARLLPGGGPRAVAGTATAGIPWAAWIAESLGVPLMYVRSKAKGWGHGRAVEGVAEPGARLLLVEDLAFTAGSLVDAAKNLREAGHSIEQSLTIVTYGLPRAEARLAALGLTHRYLTTIDDAIAAAARLGALNDDQVRVVGDWLATQRDVAQR